MKEHASGQKLVRRMSNTPETLKKKKKKKDGYHMLPNVAKLILRQETLVLWQQNGSIKYKKNKHYALKMQVGAANSSTWTQ